MVTSRSQAGGLGPLRHVPGLLANPAREWAAIRDGGYTTLECYTRHTLLFALIPAVAGFVGTSQIGWEIGGDTVRLTAGSAARIAVLYYLAMLVAVYTVGRVIHWMGQTYGAEQPVARCVALATFTATPLFLFGAMQLYPILWLNLVIGLPVLGYTVFLFYTGVPIVMEIPRERGFLFSSAVMAFGLVALVAMLAVTAILWGVGVGPAFER